ncbi:hypothetical protein IWX49DRAFT_545765, partial [Phyllosticta citricarpa]
PPPPSPPLPLPPPASLSTLLRLLFLFAALYRYPAKGAAHHRPAVRLNSLAPENLRDPSIHDHHQGKSLSHCH